jgi:Ner family transcriptional regulator
MNTARKNEQSTDWHPADIKASLAKKGFTFARIARENGYVCNSPNSVLHKPWSQMERIVSNIIGVKASEIWPSRYDRRGRPLKERTARIRTKDSRLADMRKVGNV